MPGRVNPGYVIAPRVQTLCRSDNIVNKTNGREKNNRVRRTGETGFERLRGISYIILNVFIYIYKCIMRSSNNIIATARTYNAERVQREE
jgi:hypothetical protein